MRRDEFLFGLGTFSIWISFRMWLGWLLREPIVPAGRRRKLWMGSRLHIQHFSLATKYFFCNANGTASDDKVAVSESQAGCFAYRAGSPARLSSARCTSKASAFDVLPHRSERPLCFLVVLWVQPGVPGMDVYVCMGPAILLSCYCPSADADFFPQLTTGAESRSLSIFPLQNKERNPPQNT